MQEIIILKYMTTKKINLPWYDPNPRRVLDHFNQDVKEEVIIYPLKEDSDSDIMKASPIFLAFAISDAAEQHLKSIQYVEKKFRITISDEQIKKLYYTELLSLHYFLITFFLNKYIHGNQFSLFVLRTHVALLDLLHQQTKTDTIEKLVSEAILDGERFYLHNKLTKKEKQEILSDIKFFDAKKDTYENDITIHFIIKSNYRISEILSVRKNPFFFLPLSYANKPMVESTLKIAKEIRPVWHLPEDKRAINNYKDENSDLDKDYDYKESNKKIFGVDVSWNTNKQELIKLILKILFFIVFITVIGIIFEFFD